MAARDGPELDDLASRVAEEHDIRRGVYDRLVNAAIAVVISAAIALHDHLGLK